MLSRKDSSPLGRLIRLMAEERDLHRFLHVATADDELMDEVRRLISGPAPVGTAGRCRELCARHRLPDSEFQSRLQTLGSLMRAPESSGDPYAVLGVAPGSDQDVIKAAFRRLCLRWHPDLNSVDPEAGENFQRIKDAYEQILARSGGDGLAEQPGHVWMAASGRSQPARGRWRSLLPLLLIVVLLVGVGEIVVRRHDTHNETGPAPEPVARVAPSLEVENMVRYSVRGVTPGTGEPDFGGAELETAPASEVSEASANASSAPDDMTVADLAGANATGLSAVNATEERPASVSADSGSESVVNQGEYLRVLPVRIWADLAAADRHVRPAAVVRPVQAPTRKIAGDGQADQEAGRGLGSHFDTESVHLRLDAFLRRYIADYENRAVDAFLAHFEPGALENGRQLGQLRADYARTFSAIRRLHYVIEPQRWIISDKAIELRGTFRIDGFARDGSAIASRGRLSMELVPYRATYRVMRLQYRFD